MTSCYSIEDVDVYDIESVPYMETDYKTQYTDIPPIIDRGNLVVTFTKLGGVNILTNERVLESIRLGFLEENKNSKVENVVLNLKK